MSESKYRALLIAACEAAREAIQVHAEVNGGTERGPDMSRLRRDAKRALLALIQHVNGGAA